MSLQGTLGEFRVLDQTPHSLFWDVDALGYIFLGFATLIAVPVFAKQGLQQWARWLFLANGLFTPVIAFVYFYPQFSYGLLLPAAAWRVFPSCPVATSPSIAATASAAPAVAATRPTATAISQRPCKG